MGVCVTMSGVGIIVIYYLIWIVQFAFSFLVGYAIGNFIYVLFFEKTKLKCRNCGNEEEKAKGWDYQRCSNCKEYYYDDRWQEL